MAREGEEQITVPATTQQFTGNLQRDPLNLSNSDVPGTPLTTTLFDGSNYIAWSKQVALVLGAKLKLGFVTGSVPKPSDDSPDLGRWERCDRMVICWLLNSMKTELSGSFMYYASAKDLWTEVRERYHQGTAPIIFQLKQELMKITQGSLFVTDYYNKLTKCWHELASLNEIPRCTCGCLVKCTCKVVSRFLEVEDQDKLMHFLLHLNDEYEGIKSHILSLEPLPNLSKAYFLVMQIEKQKQFKSPIVDSIAFAAHHGEKKGNSSGSGDKKGYETSKRDQKKLQPDGSIPNCTYCDKDGHVAEACFEVIGYPDWWKGKKKRGQKVAAQAVHETPLDGNEGSSSGKYSGFDPDLVQALCQEMMKAFKGKVVTPGSYANFAGPFD